MKKREEEIRNKAKNKYPYIKGLPQTLTHKEIFIEGAKWADENPKKGLVSIDKVCDWLSENTNFSLEDIEDFCKAMER